MTVNVREQIGNEPRQSGTAGIAEVIGQRRLLGHQEIRKDFDAVYVREFAQRLRGWPRLLISSGQSRVIFFVRVLRR
jgi:hypothetical protein